jgi:hypothetical protein
MSARQSSDSFFTVMNHVSTNVKLINTVQDLLAHVKMIIDKWNENRLWFRGLSHSNYHLEPSIYRKNIWKYDMEEAKEIYTEFLRRAKPYITTRYRYSKWEWYHLMQHYGVPTRILDWTEGALIALLFALRKTGHLVVPCVWVLDPFWLNKFTSQNDTLYYSDPSIREDVDKVVSYYDDEANLPDYPIALLPAHIDVRIISQKSVFTIHGKRHDGFFDICREHGNARIMKLRINGRKVKSIRKELTTLGVTETSLFPDLEGLAREIKWDYDMR